jgi:hypothetical protein
MKSIRTKFQTSMLSAAQASWRWTHGISHTTYPGKFLTYMQSGLPVLANVNAGNDLAQMIRDEQVGQVCEKQPGRRSGAVC